MLHDGMILDDDTRALAVAMGALDVAIAALTNFHTKSTAVQGAACRALAALAGGMPVLQERAGAAGAITAIVAAVESAPADEERTRDACEALYWLTYGIATSGGRRRDNLWRLLDVGAKDTLRRVIDAGWQYRTDAADVLTLLTS